MSATWSGTEFLDGIDGSLDEYPPVRVLFALYRLKAGGRLTLQTPSQQIHLSFHGGKVVGVDGVSTLLAGIGVEGGENDDLMGLVGKAIAGGHAPDAALSAAADGLGDQLAALIGDSDGVLRFERGIKPSGAPIPLPKNVMRIICGGLERARPAATIRQSLSAELDHEVRLALPGDTPADSWGLPPVALRLLRIIKKNLVRRPTLQQVIRRGGDERLLAADLLLQLGLITLHLSEEQPSAAPPKPSPKPEPESAPEPPDPGKVLVAELKRLRATSPWEILGLKKPAEVTDEGIDRANRNASKRFHPDQFISQSPKVRQLAAECFSVLQDAYDSMKDEGLRGEVRARLEAAERGEQYVTDRDRSEAEVLYSRGQVLFRKKDYATAKMEFQAAQSRDPNNWRCAYMLLRSLYHLSELTGEEVAQQIQDLEGPRGLTRADVLFEVAEIFMRDGAERRAHDLYDAVLKLNPEHIGARRRLRIKNMRAAAAEDESNSGVFSGLFRRKKK